MADLVRFVDSIVASPTVRLDLNGEATNGWYVRSFSAPAPRLRRSMSSNAMRDGISVGSSSYDARTLTLELECIKNDQDSAATELQKLARELDRESNFIMYQPDGATKPVFFKTFRSDLAQIDDVIAQKAMRRFTIEVLAEPFALGLRETLGPFTVSNDADSGSNPSRFDVTSTISGDVPAPLVIVNTAAHRGRTIVGVRQRGNPLAWEGRVHAESLALGADTTNPGGGPDAAMSGTGTNNFVRTSFATTPGWSVRLQVNGGGAGVDALGNYVVFLALRRSDTTSVFEVGVSGWTEAEPTESVRLPDVTSRILVKVGRWSSSGLEPNYTGGTISPVTKIWARRISGTGTLDWDVVYHVPADSVMMDAANAPGFAATSGATRNDVFDGYGQYAAAIEVGGDPFTQAGATSVTSVMQVAGGFLNIVPNQVNRFWWFTMTDRDTGAFDKSVNDTVSLSYWPRYLFVRPSAS